MMECPCRECKKRNPDCHGKCREYAEWKTEHEKVLKIERKNRNKQYFGDSWMGFASNPCYARHRGKK